MLRQCPKYLCRSSSFLKSNLLGSSLSRTLQSPTFGTAYSSAMLSPVHCMLGSFVLSRGLSGKPHDHSQILEEMEKEGGSPETLQAITQTQFAKKHAPRIFDIVSANRFDPPLTDEDLRSFMNFLSTNGHPLKAAELVDMSKTLGVSLSTRTFNTALNLRCDLKDVVKVTQMIEEMRDTYGLEPDRYGINILIKAHLISDDLASATKLLGEMSEKYGVQPDVITFNTFLHYHSRKGDDSAVSQLMLDMQQNGISPNDVTFNIRILRALRNKNLDAAKLILHEMCEDCGLSPSLSIYSAFFRHHFRNKQFDQAYQLYQEMTTVHSLHPNKHIWGMFAKAHLQSATFFFGKMAVRHGIGLNSHDLDNLIASLKEQKRNIRGLDKDTVKFLTSESLKLSNRPVTAAIVKRYCVQNRPDKAEKVVRDLTSGKFGWLRTPTDSMLLSIAQAYTTLGNVDKATEFMEMISSSEQPTNWAKVQHDSGESDSSDDSDSDNSSEHDGGDSDNSDDSDSDNSNEHDAHHNSEGNKSDDEDNTAAKQPELF